MDKIGDFSKKVNCPIRTLRFYDQIGLLRPAEIDLFSGYRYYNEDNRKEYEIIAVLKEIGFSLEEIKQHWQRWNDQEFLKKKELLLQDRKKVEKQIKSLDQLRSCLVEGKIVLHPKEKEHLGKRL